jgi:hypothetical protein
MRDKLIATWDYYLNAAKGNDSRKMRTKYYDQAYGAGFLYSLMSPGEDLSDLWNPYRKNFLKLIAEAPSEY